MEEGGGGYGEIEPEDEQSEGEGDEEKKREEEKDDGENKQEQEQEQELRTSKKRKLNATSHDSGYGSSSDSKKARVEGDTPPVNTHENDTDKPTADTDEPDDEDADTSLQNWLLAPLADHFSTIISDNHDPDPDPASKPRPTLAQWYNAPLHCFALRATAKPSKPNSTSSADLEAVELPHLATKDFRARNLQNSLVLPKYLRKAAPWYTPEDVLVMDEAHDIHMPIHPTLVRCVSGGPAAGEVGEHSRATDAGAEAEDAEDPKPTHFLKLVPPGPSARHSILRELRILHSLDNLPDTRTSKLRYPKLAGLIAPPSAPNSRTRIHAFLLELIPQPAVPLTTKMTSAVPADKREGWARGAREMLRVLHGNGIVWGDAKGDNFLVDGTAEERLWMIDFGGVGRRGGLGRGGVRR